MMDIHPFEMKMRRRRRTSVIGPREILCPTFAPCSRMLENRIYYILVNDPIPSTKKKSIKLLCI
jgi:hypothetical protein